MEYKDNFLNLTKDILHVIAYNMNNNHHRFKIGWAKDFVTWLNYWNRREGNQINNIDSINLYTYEV